MRRLLCLFGFHAYYRIAWMPSPSESVHVGCEHCTREWGYNPESGGMLLPWHRVAGFYRERGYDPQQCNISPPKENNDGLV